MDKPTLTIAEVADKVGIKVTTIRSWYQRGYLRVGMTGTDEDPTKKGLARYVSARTAIMIAVFADLLRIGVDAKRAAQAALKFAHSGNEHRNPSHLFPTGLTFIVVGTVGPRIINVDEDTRLIEALQFLNGTNESASGTFLHVDDLVIRVWRALNLPGQPFEQKEG